MTQIETIEELEALYDPVIPAALTKVTGRLTPAYRKWLEVCRFAVLATAGPEGLDASPRGDRGPLVRIMDDKTLHMPDWQGNNRLDSLRNLIRDPRVSLMFMAPGSLNVVRLNGRAVVSASADFTAGFERRGITPRTVLVISIEELYFQCAQSLQRSELWNAGGQIPSLPSGAEFLAETASAGSQPAKVGSCKSRAR
ncbi:MAG: MSMEG_1061 family FMN-dependent PPOX-type flavoprotein [Pseudomonadota bacterium]